MKALIFIFAFLGLSQVYGQENDPDKFLDWFVRHYKVKLLYNEQILFNEKELTPLPDSITFREVVTLFPENICYHINADSSACISLRESTPDSLSHWDENRFRKTRVVPSMDKSNEYWKLSKPMVYQDFAFIKVVHWDKIGSGSSTKVFKFDGSNWIYVKDINPWAT